MKKILLALGGIWLVRNLVKRQREEKVREKVREKV